MKRRVRDVMTTDVCTVDQEAPFKQVAELLAERKVSALPVLDPRRRATPRPS
jgi:CBS domain-containing protein